MSLTVRCLKDGSGHRCRVEVSEGASSSQHEVFVSAADLQRWARGRTVEDLVRDSFRFLLDREPKESILRSFELSVIKRYFPDYDG
jgi:hypothetical protein